MHPNDWSSSGFAAAKDSAGNYLLGDAVSAPRPRVWGIPVALSTQVTENTATVANLKVAAGAYVRMRPTVEVQPHGGTAEFIANQTLVRAEERLFLAVVQPKAICTVTAI